MTVQQNHGDEETLIYRSPVFDVYEGEVRFPNGKKSRQSWIDHKPCIAVVPVTDDGRLILIRQYRHTARQILTEIPAGSIDRSGETVEDAVQRELAEETGFQAKRLVKLFEGYLTPGYGNEYMYYYLALDLFARPLPPDEDEFIETLAVSLQEADHMIRTGRILDTKTALGIVLALSWLKEQELYRTGS